ncbi:MAG: lipoate--protein ligase family protein [Parachlamydiales bacterium]|nr:lipoate--protein ligase family protein [Parachlamydiales bacterium]
MKPVYLLELTHHSIFEQLQIEEALLRCDDRDIIVINHGSTPAIVMGISGVMDELVHVDFADNENIPVIRRFSGGGTVVVDNNTLFVSFLFHPKTLGISPYPESLLKWTEQFYTPLFPNNFSLKAQDYALGEKKIGGNAQYFRKDRLLHHTTFLWDYDSTKMNCLKMPKKIPSYRLNRDHKDFVTTLKNHFSSTEQFIEHLKNRIKEVFEVKKFPQDEILELLNKEHRRATVFVREKGPAERSLALAKPTF